MCLPNEAATKPTGGRPEAPFAWQRALSFHDDDRGSSAELGSWSSGGRSATPAPTSAEEEAKEEPVSEDASSNREAAAPQRTTTTTTASPAEKKKPKAKKRVRFAVVQTRFFVIGLSDNPAVSSGVPVGLEWDRAAPDAEHAIEEYRPRRRRAARVRWLDPVTRREMLYEAGASPAEVERMRDKVIAAQRDRLRSLPPLDMLEKLPWFVARGVRRSWRRTFFAAGKGAGSPSQQQTTVGAREADALLAQQRAVDVLARSASVESAHSTGSSSFTDDETAAAFRDDEAGPTLRGPSRRDTPDELVAKSVLLRTASVEDARRQKAAERDAVEVLLEKQLRVADDDADAGRPTRLPALTSPSGTKRRGESLGAHGVAPPPAPLARAGSSDASLQGLP